MLNMQQLKRIPSLKLVPCVAQYNKTDLVLQNAILRFGLEKVKYQFLLKTR